MNVNDNACCLNECVAWTFFASELASTGERVNLRNQGGWQGPEERVFDA
jgi:hypothetical protein